MSTRIDLEIVREKPGRWVLRVFAGDPAKAPFYVARTQRKVETIAIPLAKIIADSDGWPQDACEVIWRHSKTGWIRKRNTYGRDPERSKG